MAWWGKVLGGTFGFMMGGPLGAMMGAALGHQFDKGVDRSDWEGGYSDVHHETIQAAFFTTVFSLMGHIAKADGRVSKDEIDMARAVMREMQLNEEQKRVAIDLFAKGKQSDFPLDEVLEQFRQICRGRRTLIQMLVEILIQASYADGVLHPKEKKLLLYISSSLGFDARTFAKLVEMFEATRSFHDRAGHAPPRANKNFLHEAYQVLGVDSSADDTEIKKAYRRLMNQHHPDKLVSRGMPEEMIKLATEKTQEIKAAYETIKASRK